MKKFLTAAALIGVLFALPAAAQQWSASKTIVSAVGSTTTGNYPATPTTGIDTSMWTAVLIHVTSASTSTSSIVFDQGVSGSTWYPSVTISNATSTGELWACPATNRARFRIASHAAGTLTAVISGRFMVSDPIGGSCKPLANPAASYGAYTFTSITDSGLTATRVPFAGSGGLLADAAPFTYASGTLTSTVFQGAAQDTITAKLTDGAIASAPGTIVITKGSALGSSTLATPTTTTHDGYILRIVSSTGYAHVVSVASGKVNGGSNTTLTFGTAIGNSITLIAWQGVWYVLSNVGVTIT